MKKFKFRGKTYTWDFEDSPLGMAAAGITSILMFVAVLFLGSVLSTMEPFIA